MSRVRPVGGRPTRTRCGPLSPRMTRHCAARLRRTRVSCSATRGDGVVAAFASPKAAVDAAVAAQRALELPVLAPLHADQKRKYRRCSKNEQSPCISKTRPGANCARNASRLAQADTNLASDLIASGATTQSIDTVMSGAGCTSQRRVHQRCRQGVRHQLQDCAAVSASPEN